MHDKFLTWFGRVCSNKALAYSEVDPKRLPDDVRELLNAYRHTLMALCAAVLLLVLHMQEWTLLVCTPLIAGCLYMKHVYEKKLDPLLEPYRPRVKP